MEESWDEWVNYHDRRYCSTESCAAFEGAFPQDAARWVSSREHSEGMCQRIKFKLGQRCSRGCQRAAFESKLHAGIALLPQHATSGSVNDTRWIFDGMEECDIVGRSLTIGAYAESGRGFWARASAGALEWFKEVHSNVVEAGLDSDLWVGSALLHMYSKMRSLILSITSRV